MRTKYEQIIQVENIATPQAGQDLPSVIALAEKEDIQVAAKDEKKVLLLVIDMQNDFMEGIGSLAVPGSKGDVERLTRWMYANMSKITRVMCSLDTHYVAQVFHPRWWNDENGNYPAPFTVITYDDVLWEKWKPLYGELEDALEYLKYLEETGKKQLCIWPYHCINGTYGAGLEGEFAKMLYFHATVRKSTPNIIQKGEDPFSEMYGIIESEYNPTGMLKNEVVLRAMLDYDEIYIAGEAASHCVLESVRQILNHGELYYWSRYNVFQKITVLEDCMSPIPGCEQATADTFAEFVKQYGIRVAKSTDIIL